MGWCVSNHRWTQRTEAYCITALQFTALYTEVDKLKYMTVIAVTDFLIQNLIQQEDQKSINMLVKFLILLITLD